MNKFLVVFLLLIIPFSLFPNDQKIVPIDSEIYSLMSLLEAEAGVSSLSAVKPFSEAQIKNIIEQIDEGQLSQPGKIAMKRLEKLLEHSGIYQENGFLMDVSIAASIESYLHSSDDETQWYYAYEDRRPFLTVTAETWFNKGFYAVMEPDFEESRFIITDTDDDGEYKGNYTNLPVSFGDLNYHFPDRGFFSFGGSNWNIQLGRDQFEYGNGKNGKLLLSSYPDYYDFFKIRGYTDNFAYTWTYLNFESWTDYDPAQRYQVDHALEARFFDKFTLSVNESSLFYGESTELQFINPLIVYHNLFRNHPITDEDGNISVANICMTAGFSIVPLSGIEFYGEYLLDEISTGLEQAEYGSEVNVTPNADAHLLGIDFSLPVGPGYISAYFEYLYTSPWCYLLEIPEAGMVWSHRESSDILNKRVNIYKPIGYKYGPDTIAFSSEAGYTIPGMIKAALTADYILKGGNTIATEYEETAEAAGLKTPTGIPEYKLVIGLYGTYEIFPFLCASVNLAYININNFNHEPESVFNDFQAVISVKMTISNETFM